jgi:rod shape-determining protein MreC
MQYRESNMGLFSFDFKKIVLLLFAVALPLISITFLRGPGETPWFLEPVYWSTNKLQKSYYDFSQVVRNTTIQYINIIGVKTELKSVKDKNAELQAQLLEMQEIRNENERLSQMLDFKTRSSNKLLPAKVIGLDLFDQHSTIKINRGSLDGITKGQAVIAPSGVVGTVIKSDPDVSQVLVLTDRYSAIDAITERTRSRGIVEGRSFDGARLKYLQRTDDVVEGDLVVTSGFDSIFPQGFPIGKVVGVEKKAYGVSQKVDIEPLVDPSSLEEVFVVLVVKNKIVESAVSSSHQGVSQ